MEETQQQPGAKGGLEYHSIPMQVRKMGRVCIGWVGAYRIYIRIHTIVSLLNRSAKDMVHNYDGVHFVCFVCRG